MNSPLLLIPWLLLSLPLVSLVKWNQLRAKQRSDYSDYVQWKEFPLVKTFAGKLAFFLVLGVGSVLNSVPAEKTFIAMGLLGACGFLIEATIVLERPLPAPGYRRSEVVCQNCAVWDHDHCTNLRMLDRFEDDFKSTDGFKRPVCCCGFRLGNWVDVEQGGKVVGT